MIRADTAWLQQVVVCPACLAEDILTHRRQQAGIEYVVCRRCGRAYPVDRFGIIDFQVSDRLSTLPDGALEMWALAQARSLDEYRQRSPASVATWQRDAVKGFVNFMTLDGLRVLDVGSGTDYVPAYIERSALRQYVALDPLPVDADVPYTKVQAWAELMPFANATFDAVICGTSLDHVLCLESGMRELHRVLRADGVLYLWVALFPNPKWYTNLFPTPLFDRGANERSNGADPIARQAAAAAAVAARVADVGRLEAGYQDRLVDPWHFRHLPLQLIKLMPLYGFRPEAIDVFEHNFHFGSIFLNAFVRLRRQEDHQPADQALVAHLDMLNANAVITEKLLVIQDTQREVDALRADVGNLRAEVAGMSGELRWMRYAAEHPLSFVGRLAGRMFSKGSRSTRQP